MERENISKMTIGLQEMLTLLPPPPIPPLPSSLLHMKKNWNKKLNQKENKAMSDHKSKMSIDVVNELEKFIK